MKTKDIRKWWHAERSTFNSIENPDDFIPDDSFFDSLSYRARKLIVLNADRMGISCEALRLDIAEGRLNPIKLLWCGVLTTKELRKWALCAHPLKKTTTIIPEILAEPTLAGCEDDEQELAYFAGEISRLRAELAHLRASQPDTNEPPSDRSEPRSNPVWERRIGRFNVPHYLLEDWNLLREVMARVLIVRAESLYHGGDIEYIAYSPLFDPTHPSMEPPRYQGIISKAEDGSISVTFEREPTHPLRASAPPRETIHPTNPAQ